VAHNLLLALQITAIGMGLVFGSIILFWLLMAAMVRLTSAGRPHGGAPTSPGAEQPSKEDTPRSGLRENLSTEGDLRKRRAVVAAVAVALARRSSTAGPPARLASPVAQASAWQLVQRAKSLRIFPRGPAR
jgi:Na+-transporting methylmalonyl-CoA/oxaloacetate decarboxylase gamma subunit